MAKRRTRSGFGFISGLSDLAAGPGMLIFMPAPFSRPVLALTALAAVALLIPAVVGAVLAAPLLLAGGGGDHVIACPAIPSPPGAATVKRQCDGVGASALGRPVVPAFRGAGEVR
jgi:hypothetical protein